MRSLHTFLKKKKEGGGRDWGVATHFLLNTMLRNTTSQQPFRTFTEGKNSTTQWRFMAAVESNTKAATDGNWGESTRVSRSNLGVHLDWQQRLQHWDSCQNTCCNIQGGGVFTWELAVAAKLHYLPKGNVRQNYPPNIYFLMFL